MTKCPGIAKPSKLARIFTGNFHSTSIANLGSIDHSGFNKLHVKLLIKTGTVLTLRYEGVTGTMKG